MELKMTNQTQAALKLAIDAIQNIMDSLDKKGIWYSVNLDKAKYACKAALEQPTNMVTAPLDKLEDMERRLKALDNAREAVLEWECEHGSDSAYKECYMENIRPIKPLVQPATITVSNTTQPQPRKDGCTRCGYCAATGEKIKEIKGE